MIAAHTFVYNRYMLCLACNFIAIVVYGNDLYCVLYNLPSFGVSPKVQWQAHHSLEEAYKTHFTKCLSLSSSQELIPSSPLQNLGVIWTSQEVLCHVVAIYQHKSLQGQKMLLNFL